MGLGITPGRHLASSVAGGGSLALEGRKKNVCGGAEGRDRPRWYPCITEPEDVVGGLGKSTSSNHLEPLEHGAVGRIQQD